MSRKKSTRSRLRGKDVESELPLGLDLSLTSDHGLRVGPTRDGTHPFIQSRNPGRLCDIFQGKSRGTERQCAGKAA